MLKKKINFYFKSLLIIFLISIFTNISVYADDSNDNITSPGFSYNVNYTKSQLPGSSYPNLLLKPEQEETFSLTLSNPSDEEVNIDIGISGAKTNKNGVIEYAPSDIPNDKSLRFPFEKTVTGPKEVTLKPKESKNIEFKVTMPNEEFDGIIVGGISLIRSKKDDNPDSNQGTQIINRYRYIVPVILQNNQNYPLPKLELQKVYPGQLNSRNTIFVDFSNINSNFFDDMSVEVNITEKGKETILYQTKKNAMRMAPNSLIQFPVSMQGDRMVEGDYTANILVKGSKGIIERWTKDFKITQEQADKYNERDIGLYEEKTTNWKLIIGIVIGVLLLIAIIYFILSKKNKKKQEGANKASKKKNKKRNK